MEIEELQVTGHAVVMSIDACPAIADGEGSVVTARFVTRQVDTIARVEIMGARIGFTRWRFELVSDSLASASSLYRIHSLALRACIHSLAR